MGPLIVNQVSFGFRWRGHPRLASAATYASNHDVCRRDSTSNHNVPAIQLGGSKAVSRRELSFEVISDKNQGLSYRENEQRLRIHLLRADEMPRRLATPSDKPMNGNAPSKFGKYWLTDQIAVGGMAELYRGKISGDEGFEKAVAVKKILPHLAVEQEAVSYFIDEARLAALLQHPNIVQIYDFGRLEDTYFLAMEYLFGKDLKSILSAAEARNLPLSLENSLHIISRICAGLDYAHNMKDLQGNLLNIIHRDVSPQNIFITYDGQVKIIDFGIAKAASRITSTRSGVIKGKVAYMSPEQAEGMEVDHRADIFSAGILLYEMVTGRFMYDGDAMEILSQAREARFVRPERIVRDLPECLVMVLDLALAKDCDNRYSSCGEMLSDLEDCVYTLNFRPSDQKLAQYMKILFEKEYRTEEALKTRALRSVVPPEEPPALPLNGKRSGYQETIVIEPPVAAAPAPARGSKRNLVLMVLSVLVVIALGGWWWQAQRAGHRSNGEAVVVQIPNGASPEVRNASPREAPQGGGTQTPAPPAAQEIKPHVDPRVAEWLKTAGKYLDDWNLTAPAGANAYEEYQKVLKLDPENAAALNGMKLIADRYATLADKRIDSGRYTQALEYVALGLEIDPRNKRLWNLREQANRRIEQERQQKIQQYLIKANDSFNALRLTTPSNDSALYYYRMVQQIDPGNAEARKGLTRIADRYAAMAEKEMNRFRYESARHYVDTGLEVDPQNSRLLAMQREVNKRLDQRVLRSIKNFFD
jgi:serine/threonine protein kinase